MTEKRVLFLESGLNTSLVRAMKRIIQNPAVMSRLDIKDTIKLVSPEVFENDMKISEETELIICTSVYQCKQLQGRVKNGTRVVLYTNDPREPIEDVPEVPHHFQTSDPTKIYEDITDMIKKYLDLP